MGGEGDEMTHMVHVTLWMGTFHLSQVLNST